MDFLASSFQFWQEAQVLNHFLQLPARQMPAHAIEASALVRSPVATQIA